MPILAASHLRKTYYSQVTGGAIHALQDASISVEPGEIFGVLGPNGAGKTTLLNCLSLLLEPDEGEVQLFGKDVRRNPRSVKGRINMSSGNANFPWCATVLENLRFYGYLYGLWGKPLRLRIEEMVDLLELGKFADRRFDELSTGTKQRLALAKALINRPELLFLDEPTIGLDPDVSHKIRSFIQRLNRENKITIVLTSHYMPEVEQLVHRAAFLQDGKVITVGTPQQLKEQSTAKSMEEVFLQLSHRGE